VLLTPSVTTPTLPVAALIPPQEELDEMWEEEQE
jgi:hypothetical protein